MWRVNGLINDCARLVEAGKAQFNWFDMSTLKEPYRIEGKKTMGLELAVQLKWHLPDVVFYPTGGGTGLIGMWKGWQELAALGWISGRLPRPRVRHYPGVKLLRVRHPPDALPYFRTGQACRLT